jgi:hypothetical protein
MKPELNAKEQRIAASLIAGVEKRVAAPGDEIDELVAKLAHTMAERVDALENAASIVHSYEVEMAKASDALMVILRKGGQAKPIAAALKKNKVDTGQLNSRLIDEVERRSGASIYPPKWNITKAKHAIVEA